MAASAVRGTQRGEVIAGFVLGETLGMGTYGKVKLGSRVGDSGTEEQVAVKILDGDGRKFDEVRKEIAVHKLCQGHPNVVGFVDFKRTTTLSYIVLELAEGGELYHRIEPNAGVKREVAHFVFVQLIAAVQFFQDKGVAHRDIKPENILLDRWGNVKVTDFGLATVYRHKGVVRMLNKKCGTPPYVAPEVFAGHEYKGEMVDLWSCGVVLVALLAGWLPWRVPSPIDPDYKSWAEPRHDDCSWVAKCRLHDAYDPLLLGILNPTIEDRWNAKMIVASAWFRQCTPLTMLMGEDGLIHADASALRVEEPSLELSGSTPAESTPSRAAAATAGSAERESKRARFDTGSQPDSLLSLPASPPDRGGCGAASGTPRIKRATCFRSRLSMDETVKRVVAVLDQLRVERIGTEPKLQGTWTVTKKPGAGVGTATILVEATDPDGVSLHFTVRVRPQDGGKLLVDFMYLKGNALEFKRKFAEIKEILFDEGGSFGACTETQYASQYV